MVEVATEAAELVVGVPSANRPGVVTIREAVAVEPMAVSGIVSVPSEAGMNVSVITRLITSADFTGPYRYALI